MRPLLERLDPPPLHLDPALEWCLRAAFGPPPRSPAADALTFAEPGSEPAGGSSDAARGAARAALAMELGLGARIVSRWGRRTLEEEVGAAAAEPLVRARAVAVASGEAVVALALGLETMAVEAGARIVALKLGGQLLARVTPIGSRGAADLDLLIEAGRANEWVERLVAAGFERSPLPPAAHEVAVLRHPELGVVDLHRSLPGVRLAERRSAVFEELAAAGRLVSAGAGQGALFVPDGGVLIAHALVHGLVQHAAAGGRYEPLRLLADLADLSADAPVGAWDRAEEWLARDLAPRDLAAARALVETLRRGEPRAALDGDAGILLAHLVGAARDPDYQRHLTWRFRHAGPSDAGGLLSRARDLRHALLPSAAELEAIYGRPARGLGGLGLRLRRPFDVLRKALAAARRR